MVDAATFNYDFVPVGLCMKRLDFNLSEISGRYTTTRTFYFLDHAMLSKTNPQNSDIWLLSTLGKMGVPRKI